MNTLDKKFKAKIMAYLHEREIKGICDGIYLIIKDKCRSIPIGIEHDFIEALLIKAIIDHFLESWSEGCKAANLNKDTITETLTEIRG